MNRIARILVLLLSFAASVFARQESAKFIYLSPRPNSDLVSLSTNIILRTAEKLDRLSLQVSQIRVSGSKSGVHTGRFVLSDDERTTIFLPSESFAVCESVAVSVGTGIKTVRGSELPPTSFSFITTPLAQPLNRTYEVTEDGKVLPRAQEQRTSLPLNKSQRSDTLPPDLPRFRLITTKNPAPGNFYLSTVEDLPGIGHFIYMLDNGGQIVRFKRMEHHIYDFQVQPNGLMTYADPFSDWGYAGGGRTVHRVLDSSFAVVDSFKAGNGYDADNHAFVILPNGHALVHAYDIQYFDLSKIVQGGSPNAIVVGSILQELDLQKNVVFQWRSWDYIPITDTYMSTAASAFDYIHINGHELDDDGNILASFRNTCDIMKINRMTGDIMWRMGGKKNEFTFIGENEANAPAYYTYQHGFNRAPNGNYLIFDNGNLHKTQFSRAAEYKVDQTKRTATLVWEYRHTPDVFAPQRGSVQRLPNGNTVIGWGSASFTGVGSTTVTEVAPDKSTVFEMESLDRMPSFSARKFVWNAQRIPAAAVTKYELLPGVHYEFKQGDTVTTGVFITITQANFGYNGVTLRRFECAPLNQAFEEPAPFMKQFRFAIEKFGMPSFTADLTFDSTVVGRFANMNRSVVYFRETEGTGKFVPLTSVFDASTKSLTATITKFGEFVVGVPDQPTIPLNPTLVLPLADARVNQSEPILIRWSSYGHITGSHLQIAPDSLFYGLLVNDSSLASSFYFWRGSAKSSRYFWRVRVMNERGSTVWSPVGSFATAAPYMTITSPTPGERLKPSTSYVIQWDFNTGSWVRLGLYRNGQFALKLADSVENTGRYVWKIPGSGIVPDSSYTLRITNLNDPTILAVSARFTVTTSTGIQDESLPDAYSVSQNYPNPFNPSTIIAYQVPRKSHVFLRIYNALGQLVATIVDEQKDTGVHQARWYANAPSGVYFYQVHMSPADRTQAGEFSATMKMVLLH